MFQAKVKANVLKDVIDVTSPLVHEVKFNITAKDVSLRAVDPAHVAMVDLRITSDAFEEYTAEELELGVDMDKFSSIMRLAGSDETVTLDFDQKQNRLVIQIGNLVRKMALIDTAGMPDPKMPTLELPGKVVVNASELTKGVKASESISDHLALTVKKDSFQLYAEGDTDTVDLTIPKDSLIDISTTGKIKSLFSIDYFANMIKPIRANEAVTIFLGNDNPTKLEFDVAQSNGHVTYLLAPRIESE